tara:strand:- start:1482 stop:1616 length:135 start_codon:yes stop_codon:yes gene_type:complete
MMIKNTKYWLYDDERKRANWLENLGALLAIVSIFTMLYIIAIVT